jgi:hypothetical protein
LVGSSGKIENKRTWKKLLSSIAEAAFEEIYGELNPPELLRRLYHVIEAELAGFESRKHIETALNALANHEETHKWLSSFPP